MELISVIHNAANSSGDSIDYLNVPWGMLSLFFYGML